MQAYIIYLRLIISHGMKMLVNACKPQVCNVIEIP